MGLHKLHVGAHQRYNSGYRMLLAAVVVQALNDCDTLAQLGEDNYIIKHDIANRGYDGLNWFIETDGIIEAFVSWQNGVTPDAVREVLRKHLAPVTAAREQKPKAEVKRDMPPLRANKLTVRESKKAGLYIGRF